MPPTRETGQLPLGQGCIMRFIVDDSLPVDSINHHWTEVTYDGEPDSSVPDIGSHWHKLHEEYMEVLEGRVDLVLEGQSITLRPGDPRLHIPRMKVHSFKFVRGVRTVLTERTDPAGDFKERFFRQLLDTTDGVPNFFSVMRSFYDGDTYLALPGGFKGFEENVTWLLGRIAGLVASK